MATETELIYTIGGDGPSNFHPVVKAIPAESKTRWLRRGWTKSRNDLLRDTAVSCTARLLYLLLISRCIKHDFCVPGQDTLAREMGFSSTKTVRKYLRELERAEWIYTRRRGFNKSNSYSSVYPEIQYVKLKRSGMP